MKIALVSFLADINDQQKIDQSLSDKYESLNNNFEITEIDAEEVPYHDFSEYDLTINFIKSGGSENKFADVFDYLPRPVYLFAVERYNSLPAALEILSFVKSEDVSAKILHGEMDQINAEIKKLAEYKKVRESITEARIGIIGKPSDWLIGSKVDYEHAGHHWGTQFIDIVMEDFYKIYEKVDEKKAEKKAAELEDAAEKMVENSHEDLVEAAKIYYALKEIIDKYSLDALTLRCFDIVEELNTTGCLALALLNNEGIIAGCEGDIPAVFTMYLAYQLTGEIPFMANPAAVDSKEDNIIFAHCTIATSITDKFILRSHFETGIGVGIQGIVDEGTVTVFKIAGAGLEQYFAAEGRIIDNLDSSTACRTQLKVNLPGGSDYFLNDAAANHHILISGSHTDKINEFLGME
jgi:L-fucose isomerase-like protein